MDDLVSIIMPSYNTAEYIGDSIASIQAQTYQNWELIIVDDCSTDETDSVLKPYLSDSRIRYLKNIRNCGAALTRNYALREARGKWIAFLDSDDLWMPEKLENQLQFMQDHHFHFTYTKYMEIDERSNPNGVVVSGPAKITKVGMYLYCWPGCLTVMYDADYVGLIQIEDIRKNNDYAMWLKICKKTDCYFLPECLAAYRKHSGSISSGSKAKLIRYHYLLWKNAMHRSALMSVLFTTCNLFCGIVKKLFYRV